MTTPVHLDVRRTAELARLRLTAEEAAAFGGQLDRILGYIGQLESVDTAEVPPMAHPHDVFDVTRPDAARPGLTTDDALRNAPKRSADQFMVPKVVE